MKSCRTEIQTGSEPNVHTRAIGCAPVRGSRAPETGPGPAPPRHVSVHARAPNSREDINERRGKAAKSRLGAEIGAVLIVYGVMSDGAKTVLFQETNDFDLPAWAEKRKASLELLGIVKVEYSTIER